MRRGSMLGLFALGVVALAGCYGGGDIANTHPTTFADAKALAAERGVPLLVDFYTDW